MRAHIDISELHSLGIGSSIGVGAHRASPFKHTQTNEVVRSLVVRSLVKYKFDTPIQVLEHSIFVSVSKRKMDVVCVSLYYVHMCIPCLYYVHMYVYVCVHLVVL